MLENWIISFYGLTPDEIYKIYLEDPDVQALYGLEIKSTRFVRDPSNKNSLLESLRISPAAHRTINNAKRRYILEKKFKPEDLPQIIKRGVYSVINEAQRFLERRGDEFNLGEQEVAKIEAELQAIEENL